MVGIVIVSHSAPLAEAIVDLAHLMAPDVPMRAAGGMEEGGFGTSYDRIENAIHDVDSDDGVLVLADMGSSVMTTELVLEDLEDEKIRMADCPVVEGAIAAAVEASGGSTLRKVLAAAEETREVRKL